MARFNCVMSRRKNNMKVFPESCRVCLKLSKEVRCLLIKSEHNEDLLKKLRTLMQREFKLDLHLPNNLCKTCENDLENAYNFVKTCYLTNLKIRNYNKLRMNQRPCEAEDIKMEIEIDEMFFPSNNSHFEITDTEISEIKSDDIHDAQGDKDVGMTNSDDDDDVDVDNNETKLGKQDSEKYLIEFIDIDNKNCGEAPNDVTKKADDIAENKQSSDSEMISVDVQEMCQVKTTTQEVKHEYNAEGTRVERLQEEARKQKKDAGKDTQKSKHETIVEIQHERLQATTQEAKFTKKPRLETCPKCNAQTADLQKHNAVRHDSATARIYEECLKGDKPTCKVCGKTFGSKNTLREHIRLKHTEDIPHVCRFCNLRAQNAPALKRHELTHTGEKPFICHYCGKGFVAKTNLSSHLPQHTGKKYICHVCGKACIRSSHLKIHMTQHTGEFRFTCSYCDKKFYMNGQYQKHLHSHTNERPYTCHICGKAFKQTRDHKKHLKLHTGEKRYRCMYCPYACWEPFRLRQHTKTHEKEWNFGDKANGTSQETST